MSPRTLIAGIGNIFFSDDAFGVEVANELAHLELPPEVRVEDYGIRGIHLAYELLEGYDTLVLIDAVSVGEPPGTLVVLEPDLDDEPVTDEAVPALDAHTMNPAVVLSMLRRLGGTVDRTVVVGCQPADLREGMGLSDTVRAAVAPAVALCLEVVSDLPGPTQLAEKGAAS